MLENNELNKDKIDVLTKSIARLENKTSKFLFCVPDTPTPSASIYELYTHANAVIKLGYKAIILTERRDLKPPDWIESEYTDIPHLLITDSKLTVSPDDFMIIPDVFTNIMEQTKKLPCTRICLVQSLDYLLNSLIPGTDLTNFGINEVITTSKVLEDKLNIFFKDTYKIKKYSIGIPDYFTKSQKPQKPVVSIVSRNSNDISKVIKLFYCKYPQYRWVTFDPLLSDSKPPTQLSRVDFAERVSGNFAAVWIDRISSFGTFPLECMKSGVIPIFVIPDLIPEYIKEGNDFVDAGLYTDNVYDIPTMIGDLLSRFIDDSIPEDIYDKMQEISSKYSIADSINELGLLYTEYINDKIELFKKTLND